MSGGLTTIPAGVTESVRSEVESAIDAGGAIHWFSFVDEAPLPGGCECPFSRCTGERVHQHFVCVHDPGRVREMPEVTGFDEGAERPIFDCGCLGQGLPVMIFGHRDPRHPMNQQEECQS